MPEQEFVGFDGGPLIALPESALGSWGGVSAIQAGYENKELESFSPGDDPTDYDRACATSDWATLIAVGAEQGLVMAINDEPGPVASWIRRPDGGIFLSGGIGECNDVETAAQLEEFEWKPLDASLTLTCDALLVSTAAAPGTEFSEEDHLRVVLGTGEFEVSVAEYGTAEAVGIRLRRR